MAYCKLNMTPRKQASVLEMFQKKKQSSNQNNENKFYYFILMTI